MIGKHKPKDAQDTGLKELAEIGLDEAFTALEESFHDLTDEQAAAFPVDGRANVVWIVMHAGSNLDCFANATNSTEGFKAWGARWGHWGGRWDFGCESPTPEESYPSTAEMMRLLKEVRADAMDTIRGATDEFLAEPPQGGFAKHKRRRADFYARTIFHTMSHVRQIWLLRGALGLSDGESWPRQHWW